MNESQNKYEYIIRNVTKYACSTVSLIGFILNILCFLVFNGIFFKKVDKEKFKNYELYFFLKIESIFISLNLFLQTFRLVFYHNQSYKLISLYYELYILDYCASCLENVAILCHTLSTINFYIMLKDRKKSCCFSKLRILKYYNHLMCIFIFVLSIFQFMHKIIGKRLNQTPNEFIEDQFTCSIELNEFGKSIYFKIWEIIAFLLRDALVGFVLIVLNILIYFKVNKSIKYKQTMLENSYNFETSHHTLENRSNESIISKNKLLKLEKVKSKTAIMVIATCLNIIIGKLPICLFYVLKNIPYIYENSKDNKDMLHLIECFAILFVYINYCGCFFIYYFTNRSFKLVIWVYFEKFSSKFVKFKVTPSK